MVMRTLNRIFVRMAILQSEGAFQSGAAERATEVPIAASLIVW